MIPPDSPLQGKVAVVTGASRGIGADIAAQLALRGARVVCAARTRNAQDHPLSGSLEESVNAIRAAGGDAIAVEANLARDEDCLRLVEVTRERFGAIDILVNNAAVGFFGPAETMSVSHWMLSWRVMCHATFLLSQLALADMLARGAGRIVNLTSESAIGPGRGPYDQLSLGDTCYGAHKAAIERFTQGLAQEVYARGVAVAAVAPSQLVASPGAVANGLVNADHDPRAELPEYVPRAVEILLTAPLAEVSGRVVYSQQLLAEYGQLDGGRGYGIDPQLAVSGFAQR